MLNKIENINLKTDMRNEIKPSKKEYGVSKIYKKENFADTLTYSDSLIYISQLNWKLKKIVFSNDDILEIEVAYENYSFNFLINLKTPAINGINLKISDSNVGNYSNVRKFILDVSFNYRLINSDSINYDILETVFTRIRSFFLNGEYQINSIYYTNILTGIEVKLISIFSQIYKNIIEFIKKLNNKNLILISEESSSLSSSELIIRGIYVEY